MKRYILTTFFGFIGMFAAYFLLFIFSSGLGWHFMPYILVYPLVYLPLVFFLTRKNPTWWFTNAFCTLLIPFVYWYWLLWSDRKLHFNNGVKLGDSSGMLLVLPLTFVLAISIALFVFKHRQHALTKD